MHNIMHAHGLRSRKGCTWLCLEVPAFREQKLSEDLPAWYYPPASAIRAYPVRRIPDLYASGRCLHCVSHFRSMKAHKTAPSSSNAVKLDSCERAPQV